MNNINDARITYASRECERCGVLQYVVLFTSPSARFLRDGVDQGGRISLFIALFLLPINDAIFQLNEGSIVRSLPPFPIFPHKLPYREREKTEENKEIRSHSAR